VLSTFLLLLSMLVVMLFLIFLLYSSFVPKQRSSDVVGKAQHALQREWM
jgi:hypothetical protein